MVHNIFCKRHKVISFSRWMVEHAMVQADHGILLSTKKEHIIDIHNNLDEFQRHLAELKKKKAHPNICRLHDFIYNMTGNYIHRCYHCQCLASNIVP